MTLDVERQLRDLDIAVQHLLAQYERLRQHLELVHVECAANTKRCSDLQDEMKSIRDVLHSLKSAE